MTWPKLCACGHVITRSTWKTLKRLGVQKGPSDSIELRNCPGCGSTLGIALKDLKPKKK